MKNFFGLWIKNLEEIYWEKNVINISSRHIVLIGNLELML